jgi:hypothetical protein
MDEFLANLSNAASAIVRGEGSEHYLVYYWREGEDIPYDVTHVKIHSSVRAIQDGASTDACD